MIYFTGKSWLLLICTPFNLIKTCNFENVGWPGYEAMSDLDQLVLRISSCHMVMHSKMATTINN